MTVKELKEFVNRLQMEEEAGLFVLVDGDYKMINIAEYRQDIDGDCYLVLEASK